MFSLGSAPGVRACAEALWGVELPLRWCLGGRSLCGLAGGRHPVVSVFPPRRLGGRSLRALAGAPCVFFFLLLVGLCGRSLRAPAEATLCFPSLCFKKLCFHMHRPRRWMSIYKVIYMFLFFIYIYIHTNGSSEYNDLCTIPCVFQFVFACTCIC